MVEEILFILLILSVVINIILLIKYLRYRAFYEYVMAHIDDAVSDGLAELDDIYTGY